MVAELWNTLVGFTISVTVAVALVTVLRPLALRAFGVSAAYTCWVLVPTMICAVMIPAPSTHDPLVETTFTFLRGVSQPLGNSVHVMNTMVAPAQILLLLAWGAGTIVSVFVTLLRQRRYWRSLGQVIRDDSGVLRAERATGPALIGFLFPRLMLPASFEQCHTAMERTMMLAHEEVHRRRADPLANAFGELVRCLQWFNPLVRWAHGIYRQHQELACDAIAAGADFKQRAIYAELLVKTQRSLDDLNVFPLGAAWHPVHPLTARLASLRRHAPSVAVSRLGASVLGLTALVAAYGGWTMRAEAAAATGGVPIALRVNWSVEHAPKGSTPTKGFERRYLVTDTIVPSGAALRLFFPSKSGAHEYELNCTPKVLSPPLVITPDGQKVSGRFWIECAFKRRDGVTLSYHPKLVTWDNQEIGIKVGENDGAGGKLVYRVMINPSTSKARIEQARAAQIATQER